jgi:hypothetical protein
MTEFGHDWKKEATSSEQEQRQALYENYRMLEPKPLEEASRTLPPELISGILYQGRRKFSGSFVGRQGTAPFGRSNIFA